MKFFNRQRLKFLYANGYGGIVDSFEQAFAERRKELEEHLNGI